ncbi:MAG: BspA family leucine-rich repeat surface protein [Saprospiraceae bacterium]|nr:BspA family leucine-rich repeat surface protein [Saprospiraceae bacterium]
MLWQTTTQNESITIPTFPGETYNYSIDWGNSQQSHNQTGNSTHTYFNPGLYTVRISGDFPRIYFNNSPGTNKLKILRILDWGTAINWTSMQGAFYGCANLNLGNGSQIDAPNLTNVTDMSSMFRGCTNLTQNIDHWDVSTITNMSSLFEGATNFNRNLHKWVVDNVTDMSSMFKGASSFNGVLNKFTVPSSWWDVSNVTDMSSMFQGATSFNQDLTWTVSNVTDMSSMFQDAESFDQDLTFWNVENVTDMSSMFHGAESFNGELENWNVRNVTDMSSMFQGALFFNKELNFWEVANVTDMSFMFKDAERFREDLSFWDVENVTDMTSMFQGAALFNGDIKDWDVKNVTKMGLMFQNANNFNQDIGNWDVRNVTIMSSMFTEATSFNQDIGNWDVGQVDFMGNMFAGATAFNQNIGNWDVRNVMNMATMFLEASLFNQDIGNWDVGNVTNMALMFYQASSFDQNIGNWNVSNVTNMGLMFGEVASLSTSNYDSLLIGWNSQNVQSGVQFSGGFSMYCDAAGARSQLINSKGWTISDLGSCSNFATIWETTNSNESITIPTIGSGYNYVVDWGDGTIDMGLTGDATHTYANAGLHTVKISGTFPRIYFNDSSDRDKIIYIKNWGDNNWTSMENAFRGCTQLSILANDIPDLSTATNMSNMFDNCFYINESIENWDVSNVKIMDSLFFEMTSFNQPIGSWDVSNVVDMTSMFQGLFFYNNSSSFNQPLSNWDVRNVTNMSSMFRDAIDFNQDISNWDTRNVTSMASMFHEAKVFNQDISNWDVSKVTDMTSMFDDANDFNQPIGSWDVSNVTSMESMFDRAIAFNQPIGNWNVSNVTNMESMFELAHAFNQDIGSWNVSNVTNMAMLFSQAIAFNQPIGNWNVSNVTTMEQMLAAESFNQDLSGWDVSNVTNMVGLFTGASVFNQDIGSWNVSNVTNMTNMFGGALAFDQDIGNWNVSKVENMAGMFFAANSFNQDIGSWDVSLVNNMLAMFASTSSFDQDLSSWDVSNVNTMIFMFYEALAFDQNIGSWDVSLVTDMSSMFDFSNLSTENYDSLLIGWEPQNLQQNVVFSANLTQYCTATTERDNIINNNNWTINDAGHCSSPPSPLPDEVDTTSFITVWEVAENLEVIEIPTIGTGYNYDVDWGDGSFSLGQTGSASHAYINSGFYTIKISGSFPRISFGTSGFGYKLRSIQQWGDIVWTSMAGAFSNCINLVIPASDVPNLSQVTDMSRMFYEGSNNLGPTAEVKMSEWDVSNVTDMSFLFGQLDAVFEDRTSNFNPQISSWDVSNVTKMQEMFKNLILFDQDLSSWDVSNVTNMQGMFQDNRAFNQDLSGWDVSSVTNMRFMFWDAKIFNQDISAWNVSNVTDMLYMLRDAQKFDQNLGSWDISNVTTMSKMLDHTNLSISNYDSLLIGWDSLTLQNDVDFGANDLLYCTGESARSNLINNNNWTIEDGGSCDNFKTTWEFKSPYNNAITIPTMGGGYNYSVSWGDGTKTTGHTGNASHIYDGNGNGSGIKKIIISGDFPRIYFKNALDEKKLISIDNWGTNPWASMNGAFAGCTNLQVKASDSPNLSSVTDLTEMFADAKIFNQDISDWNTGNVTNMSSMFKGADSFDQDISNWNTSNVTNMSSMFSRAQSFDQDLSSWQINNVTDMSSMFEEISLSTSNYDAMLNAWANSSVQNNVTFDGGGSIYCQSEEARVELINDNNWTIVDGGLDSICTQGNFITRWETTVFLDGITIPTNGAGYNYTVDWGDGNITTGHTGNANHIYFLPGIYTVRISGQFPQIYFNDGLNKDKIISVDQWGDTQWLSMESAFKGCSNLKVLASDTPDLSAVTDMSEMFAGCTSFNQDISTWDVNNISDMTGLFNGASNFNQNLNAWETNSLSNLTETFAFASSFNQDISAWNVANVTEMSSLFASATSFNQDLSNWDLNAVTEMDNMFENATSFNQDISNWNVSNVLSMNGVFSGANAFNQNIEAWNVSNVDSMANMFANASLFDQNLDGWNVENVKDMDGMFDNVRLSTLNYDSLLISWAGQNVQSNVTFSGGKSIYCSSTTSRASLINLDGWNISDGGNCNEFITTWETNEKIKIPTTGTGYNYTVDWGDGIITTGHTSSAQHNYATPGVKRVKITGDFPRIFFNNGGHKDKLLEINNWGNNPWTSMNSAFYGCSNLEVLAQDQPDLSLVTDMFGMFAEASSMNQDIGNWDVSNVTNMLGLFSEATSFNQDISSWDVSNVMDMSYMFGDAISFNQDLGNWDVSNATTMQGIFINAENFNQDLSNWDVSSVTDLSGAFENALSFDQDIGNWNVSNVTDMDGMFAGVALSTANYDSLLIGWSSQTLQSNVHFTAGNSIYCAGESARTMIINDNGWTITDGGNCEEFITTWETTSSPQSILIPVDLSESYNYTVDWGDGTIEQGFIGHAFHVYLNAGTYRVKITGDFPRIFFNNSGNKDKIREINNWGNGQWTSMENAFYGCNNLAGQASDTPDLSMASSTAGMFRGATSFNQEIGDWDVSTITDMTLMFEGASSFNQPIGDWDVSSVNGMFAMLNGASNFDQNLANWNIEQVTNMSGSLSFTNLSTANYDSLLISWNDQNTQIGLDLNGGNNYCAGASARSELIANKGWNITDDGIDVSCTTTQFVSTWETTSSNETISLPTSGSGYNYTVDWGDGQITTGHTGSASHTYLAPSIYVISISGDFPRIFFNNQGDKDKIKSIEQWGTGQWSRMNNAFYGCTNLVVNALDNPNLSNVDDMSSMFESAHSFNQNIRDWDVSNVTDMKDMFASNNSFDQNLGDWDISNVSDMSRMFENTTLSTSNYDSLLIGWNAQELQPGVQFDGGNSQYCLSIAERFHMMNEDSWTITDADQDPMCSNCDLLVLTNEDNIGGSLRAVINCATDGDTIQFSSYVYGDTLNLATIELIIDKEISILVPDTVNLWLEKETAGRGLTIDPSGNLKLTGLHLIANPTTTTSFIKNEGDLMLKDVQIYSPNDQSLQATLDNNGNLIIRGITKFKFLE